MRDRVRLKAELGNERHIETALPRHCDLGAQSRIEAMAIDARMALRIAGKGNPRNAVTLHQAGRQQIETVAERANRAARIAGDQKNTRLPLLRRPRAA